MPRRRYSTDGRYAPDANGLRAWVTDVRDILRSDDDCIILLSGPTGSGKSNLQLQLARLIDPTFNVDRIHFKIDAFSKACDQAKPYSALCCDEFLGNRRKSMYREMVDFNDWLQYSRYLNLALLFCFPNHERLDRAVYEDRIRFHAHVAPRSSGGRRFYLTERTTRRIRQPNGDTVSEVHWAERGAWWFGGINGPLWQTYLAKKDAHMRRRQAELDGTAEPEGTDPNAGIDYANLVTRLRELKDRLQLSPRDAQRL